jgi:hypothetical protein
MMFLLKPDEGNTSLAVLAATVIPKGCERARCAGEAALWHNPCGLPHAILRSNRQALFMPFDDFDSPAQDKLIKPFQAAIVARRVQLHGARPGRDGRDWCYVATMRLRLTSGWERKLVRVGSDGCLAVTALDDRVTASTDGSPEASWTVTSKSDSPCHTVAVYEKASVAFTGSECKATGYF